MTPEPNRADLDTGQLDPDDDIINEFHCLLERISDLTCDRVNHETHNFRFFLLFFRLFLSLSFKRKIFI